MEDESDAAASVDGDTTLIGDEDKTLVETEPDLVDSGAEKAGDAVARHIKDVSLSEHRATCSALLTTFRRSTCNCSAPRKSPGI